MTEETPEHSSGVFLSFFTAKRPLDNAVTGLIVPAIYAGTIKFPSNADQLCTAAEKSVILYLSVQTL